MNIKKMVVAAVAALALSLTALTPAQANTYPAPTGSIITKRLVKPSYTQFSKPATIQVNVAGLVDTGYGYSGSVEVSIGGTRFKTEFINQNGLVNVTNNYFSYDAVKAGKRTVTVKITDYRNGSATTTLTSKINIIGTPVLSYVYGSGKGKKARVSIEGRYQDDRDMAGKKVTVLFDAQGGKKKYVKVATAKIKSDGTFKVKTKKKLGKGKFIFKTKKTTYLKASKSKAYTYK